VTIKKGQEEVRTLKNVMANILPLIINKNTFDYLDDKTKEYIEEFSKVNNGYDNDINICDSYIQIKKK
jgi:hypothetical protein